MTATDTPEQLEADGREPALGYYLNRPVTGATLRIAGTGATGFDKALDMKPVALQPGDTVDVVLRCRVDEHRHVYDADHDDYQLVNRLRAETATIPAIGETASDAIVRAQRAIDKRKDEVDERQLTLDDERGGEPQTIGDIAEDVLDIAEQLEDGADCVNARTRELDKLAKEQGKDALKGVADGYEITGRSSMTISELSDAIVDHEQVNGLLPDAEGDDGDA